jgi:[acyl-carrier-protein] S-malonyltransferase
MTVRLAVAGAFHTDFMSPAREKLQEALAGTALSEPRIPVISNVDAAPHSDPEVIKAILAKQARVDPSVHVWNNTNTKGALLLCVRYSKPSFRATPLT